MSASTRLGWWKGADEVLALGGVDPGLAAHRRIHLGEEARRDLHEAHAALQRGGHEAREVAHDAAAERHDDVAALRPRVEHGAADLGIGGEALGTLARRYHDGRMAQARGVERSLQRRQVPAREVGVGDDHAGRARRQGGDAGARLREQARPDQDVVGPVAEPDRHAGKPGVGGTAVVGGRHGTRRPAMAAAIWSTMASCEQSRDSTVRSASA